MGISYSSNAAPSTKFDGQDCKVKFREIDLRGTLVNSVVSGVRVLPDGPKFKANVTPHFIAEAMVEWAGIDNNSVVLEPSAGTGVLRDAAKQRCLRVTSVELNKANYSILEDDNSINADFLSLRPCDIGLFTHIVMCPPKNSSQHIEHAMNFLNEGGRLIALEQERNINLHRYDYIALPDMFVWNYSPIRCGMVCHENV